MASSETTVPSQVVESKYYTHVNQTNKLCPRVHHFTGQNIYRILYYTVFGSGLPQKSLISFSHQLPAQPVVGLLFLGHLSLILPITSTTVII